MKKFIFFYLIMIYQALCLECTPTFSYKDGWLGGDAAYSIKLDQNKVLWIFGDTFIDQKTQKTRKDSTLIGNSIGISTCDQKGLFKINYFWNERNSKLPKSFFDFKGVDKLWPKDGFTYNGSLYLFMDKVNNKPEGGAFGFEVKGTILVKVDNPKAQPKSWKVHYQDMLSSDILSLASSVVKDKNHLYLFSVLDDQDHKHHPIILLRVSLKDLENSSKKIEYLSQAGKWKRGMNWKDAKEVIDQGANELTIRYHQKSKKWVAIHAEPKFLSNKIVMRTALKLEGPWSAYKVIYSVPELKSSKSRIEKEIFCYAPKEHPEFEKSGEVLFTYICSSLNSKKLLERMDLYKPINIRLKDKL